MARKKKPLVPWLTAKEDGIEGRFTQKGNSFLLNETVQSLSASSYRLYDCMCMESGGRKEFTFPKKAFKKYGMSYSTARRSIKELIDKGFITCNSGAITREDNIYTFCFEWKKGAD